MASDRRRERKEKKINKGGSEEAATAVRSTNRSESSSVLSANNLSHVRRTSWLSSSLRRLHCHLLRLRHRLHLPCQFFLL